MSLDPKEKNENIYFQQESMKERYRQENSKLTRKCGQIRIGSPINQ